MALPALPALVAFSRHRPSRFQATASTRSNSPMDYATATDTSFQGAIHSTPQQERTASQYNIPVQRRAPSEHGSEGSADMSVEMGRAFKRSSRDTPDDMSSNVPFSFRNDNSLYEITTTPPIHSRTSQPLNREAALRRASEMAKAKSRLVSETVAKRSASYTAAHHERDTTQNSRFSSPAPSIPTRPAADHGRFSNKRSAVYANTTIHSTTYTNHSFNLPTEMSNISNLIEDDSSDTTADVRRNNTTTSRFASNAYAPQAQSHRSISGVAIPDQDRQIFAGLTEARNRISQLELGDDKMQRQASENGGNTTRVQARSCRGDKHADSAFGYEEDAADYTGNQKIFAEMEALRSRLEKSEQDMAEQKHALAKMSDRYKSVALEFRKAQHSINALETENQMLRESPEFLQPENDRLKAEVEALLSENERLRAHVTRLTSEQRSENATQKRVSHRATKEAQSTLDASDYGVQQTARTYSSARSKTDGRTTAEAERTVKRSSSGPRNLDADVEFSSRIEVEVQKLRANGASGSGTIDRPSQAGQRSSGASRTASKSLQKPASASRCVSSKDPAPDLSDVESTTNLDLSKLSRRSSAARPTATVEDPAEDDTDREITVLSDIDLDEYNNMRKKIEAEHRAGRLRKQAPPPELSEINFTIRSDTRQSLPRKSSLRDVTAPLEDGTGRYSIGGLTGEDAIKIAKTVRVQSPHASDDALQAEKQGNDTGNVSILSNTSRRRRRAASDGETSAFIIPDITMHRSNSLPTSLNKRCIKHHAGQCTICAQPGEKVTIPKPVSVNDRGAVGDMTDATIRPSQPPSVALASVMKSLEDEVVHLKLEREKHNREYNQHVPAISRRKRQVVKETIDRLTAEIEKHSDQIYALYDVLEGQLADARARGEQPKEMEEEEFEQTLTSIGIDPAELSGRVGRSVAMEFQGLEGEESDELPWEGLSDVDSEEEL